MLENNRPDRSIVLIWWMNSWRRGLLWCSSKLVWSCMFHWKSEWELTPPKISCNTSPKEKLIALSIVLSLSSFPKVRKWQCLHTSIAIESDYRVKNGISLKYFVPYHGPKWMVESPVKFRKIVNNEARKNTIPRWWHPRGAEGLMEAIIVYVTNNKTRGNEEIILGCG